jgi:low temperature requirement protein LtrA
VELGTLAATGIAFFMAVAVPDAFHAQALSFAIPYVLVRGVGLYIYFLVVSENPVQRKAVTTFTIVSLSGLLVVLGGASVSGAAQYWLWGAAILLDIIAAAIGGRKQGWNLHPEHFGERHGLFVIIALGETLIVAASGLSGVELSGPPIAAAILSVGITCGLWWIYFTRTKPALDHALESRKDVEQSTMARDVFSLLHFPMLCGIIAYAFAIEEAMRHPTEPLHSDVRAALAFGIFLFTGGMNVAMWRAGGPRLLPRLLITAGISAAVLLVHAVAPVSLMIVLLGISAIAVIEERMFAAGRSGEASETSVGHAG